MGVPNVFGSATTSIPLSQLDQNFNTTATLGNAAIGLGNVTTTVGNLTLTNVNITSGTINAAVTQSGFTGNSVIYSNTSGNLTTSANLTFDGSTLTTLNSAYTGTLTGGTGIVNLGSGQFYKDASGNVGIGTASPAAKLDVGVSNGFLRSGTNGSDTNYNIRANSGSNCSITWTENGQADRWTVGCVTGQNYLGFRYNSSNMGNGTEAMRLDASGNFLVGTTTVSGANTSGLALLNPTTATVIYLGHPTGTATGSAYMGFLYNGTLIGSITQSGTTAVLYNLTSDARLKTNIADAPLGNIDDVKVRSFDWKSDGSHVEYGFIAQELVEVAPYAVHQPQDPEEMMAVDYSKLVPMMIKEIQDLKQRIKTLENK
jgi:hypothetical protein